VKICQIRENPCLSRELRRQRHLTSACEKRIMWGSNGDASHAKNNPIYQIIKRKVESYFHPFGFMRYVHVGFKNTRWKFIRERED